MKQIFIILTFIFISASAVGQSDSLIAGIYIHVEQRGIHIVSGQSFGDIHPTSYISHVDTTITNTISLDINHNVVLQIDTLFGGWTGFVPERKWFGQWQLENDTLYITFSESSTLWPSPTEENPSPIIEKLPIQIVQKFVFELYGNRIHAMMTVQEQLNWIYAKE